MPLPLAHSYLKDDLDNLLAYVGNIDIQGNRVVAAVISGDNPQPSVSTHIGTSRSTIVFNEIASSIRESVNRFLEKLRFSSNDDNYKANLQDLVAELASSSKKIAQVAENPDFKNLFDQVKKPLEQALSRARYIRQRINITENEKLKPYNENDFQIINQEKVKLGNFLQNPNPEPEQTSWLSKAMFWEKKPQQVYLSEDGVKFCQTLSDRYRDKLVPKTTNLADAFSVYTALLNASRDVDNKFGKDSTDAKIIQNVLQPSLANVTKLIKEFIATEPLRSLYDLRKNIMDSVNLKTEERERLENILLESSPESNRDNFEADVKNLKDALRTILNDHQADPQAPHVSNTHLEAFDLFIRPDRAFVNQGKMEQK